MNNGPLSSTLLAQRLIDMGCLLPYQIDELQARQVLTNTPLDVLLRESRLVSDNVLTTTLSTLSGIAIVSLGRYTIAPELVHRLSPVEAYTAHTLPVEYRDGIITLVTDVIPADRATGEFAALFQSAVEWKLCTEDELRKAHIHFYGLGAESIDILVAETADPAEETPQTVSVAATSVNSGMVRFIHQLIAEAIRMNATDIHIEPFDNALRLRYRIDGMLQNIPLPKNISRIRRAIASTIKIMANLDIAERRKPHDGRIKVRFGATEYDLRVSVLPTNRGESLNLRILNSHAEIIRLENLGISENLIASVRGLTDIPHGVILLTGPTGSGKTTTLYALLSRISTIEKKIITVEDPIEYEIGGINQIQVHPKIDLTFASALRSILRHDPDVILIGEIRDPETAEIAVRAAQTGHLVFSTLHTNDAPSAITRLMDMRIEPYLISSSLEGVIAQRLIRKVCAVCQRPMELPAEFAAEISRTYPDEMASAVIREGAGCPACNYAGYHGRCAITEVMPLTSTIRAMIIARQPANLIKQAAVAEGMLTLRQDGWLRVLRGQTTLAEILRVTGITE